ncbi:MAG TPA: hypothetical protein VEJ63_18690, partial [Planctomycetota bacterium]|nr:hypothetical protein [Planctomycetota bacterium]
EVHPDPDKALSDGPNMLNVQDLPRLLQVLQQIDQSVRESVEAENYESRSLRAITGKTMVNKSVQ